MGLDMYLHIRMSLHGLSNADYGTLVDTLHASHLVENNGTAFPAGEVWLPLYYWRKAHHIHQWFVDNHSDKVDNCEKIPVTIDDLIELGAACANALGEDVLSPSAPLRGACDSEWSQMQTSDTIERIRTLIPMLRSLGTEHWTYDLYYEASW